MKTLKRNRIETSLKTLILAGAFGSPLGALADTIEGVTYGGAGCPSGSVSIVKSADGQSVSVLFDRFIVNSGGGSANPGKHSLTCTMQIPVTVPAGQQLSVYSVDYRGYANLPQEALAVLSNAYSIEDLAAKVRLKVEKVMGPIDGNFTFTQNFRPGFGGWGRCGGTSTLRIDATLSAETNRRQEPSSAVMDSADSGLVFRLASRPCAGRGAPGGESRKNERERREGYPGRGGRGRGR